ncbi:chitinase 1 precursor [Cordyceps javanica]|uniref:Chitinase 1 n=1 Tax=Cordyceps javanica TaxID=43265 RepID=A0A545VQW3_9HYPO|nr:chitinase 1 precursor [Cordyceps javanica]TQW04096.1 chitinase 1 precursor [Cordyceps javanica]
MDPNVNASSYASSALGSTAASSVASTSPAAHVAASPSTSTAAPAQPEKPIIKRRAAIACRAEFPSRGQPDLDRDYRHPRTRAERPKGTAAKAKRTEEPLADSWEGLPPLEELVDGVNRFTRFYFQLGFLPKRQYPEKLRMSPHSCNLFLLLSILSVSARMTPALCARYGTGVKAAEYFMERASRIALERVYAEPSLELCQAFYLLSIAQHGSGLRNKSYMNMGVAVRMATLMMLHREETYKLNNPTREAIMVAESARRTIWMLHSQDNLHSGPVSPVALSASDITTLLPCDEDDFANGVLPGSRAALAGTQPANDNPALITDKNRSLFATLMQIHNLWGTVGRRAVYDIRSSNPWDSNSEFSKMAKTLSDWEASLPPSHLFSHELLRRYKNVGEDLAYLCVTMMTRLCNIVLRRPYLVDLIQRKEARQQAFFSTLSLELFRNVRWLYQQIEAQFTDRTPDESVGAQIASFCVYSCGLFSTYLCKYPEICPDPSIAEKGPAMLERTISILNESKEVWPLASRWAESLENFFKNPKSTLLTTEGSMDDGKDPIPRAINQLPPPISKSAESVAAVAAMPDRALPVPGTQPGIASATMGAPRNDHIPSSMAPGAHGQLPANTHYANQIHQPHPSPTQHQQAQNRSYLSHYQTSQPPQPRQDLHTAPLQFGNQHHQSAAPILRPVVGPSNNSPAPPLHQLSNAADLAPRWPLTGVPEPSSASATMGRRLQQPDGVGMLIPGFANLPLQAQQQHGYMANGLMMGQDISGLSSHQNLLLDGFENELLFQFDGEHDPHMSLPFDQWQPTNIYTYTPYDQLMDTTST